MRKRILAISGSTRKGSSNEAILKAIADRYKEVIDLEIYNKIDQLPHFNPDLDHETPPETVKDFRTLIQNADGVMFCTPEYVFSLPGSLKNAIEWNVSTTVFSGKPAAIIVAAASGKKALESLHLILATIECKISNESTLLIKGARGKISQEDEIKNEELLEQIDQLVEALLSSIA